MRPTKATIVVTYDHHGPIPGWVARLDGTTFTWGVGDDGEFAEDYDDSWELASDAVLYAPPGLVPDEPVLVEVRRQIPGGTPDQYIPERFLLSD